MGQIILHSTHEAAGKIAGIGAVLYGGLLVEDLYHQEFERTILAGAYDFREPARRAESWGGMGVLHFDSQRDSARFPPPSSEHQAVGPTLLTDPRQTFGQLASLVAEWGGRVAYGERRFITRQRGEPHRVAVVLASPHGLKETVIQRFLAAVNREYEFNLAWYERRFPAIVPETGPSLSDDERVFSGGKPIGGGVVFNRGRAFYPDPQGLPYKCNPYLLEVQFYTHAAPLLWAATRIVASGLAQGVAGMGCVDTFVAHDWLGIPLWWAMRLASPNLVPRTIYMAHECRIARLMVEGKVLDARQPLAELGLELGGFDVGFYQIMERAGQEAMSFDTRFSTCPGLGNHPFRHVPYHRINCEADRFGRVMAVGNRVRDETGWVLPNLGSRLRLCPNGVPMPLELDNPDGSPDRENQVFARVQLARKELARAVARMAVAESLRPACGEAARLARFARRLEQEPDCELWTSVSRTEVSKAPWRLPLLLRSYLDAHQKARVVLIWLANPAPDLPSAQQVGRWRKDYGWPFHHVSRSAGGDLLPRDEEAYQPIEQFNREYFWQHDDPRGLILFVNQFGWSRSRLGFVQWFCARCDRWLDIGQVNCPSCGGSEGHPAPDLVAGKEDDLFGSSFFTLRTGTHVELGLSTYEPFGIAALEPYFAGSVCVLSDAFGAVETVLSAARSTGVSGPSSLVVAHFIERARDLPAGTPIGAAVRAQVERETSLQCARELHQALSRPHRARFDEARRLAPVLSWEHVVKTGFLPNL
ncbi:MAG: hypothetical protein JW797_07795 [Bradymonadales bacterium]|nr:hypothetical protein [Bradymonadales bacterium]